MSPPDPPGAGRCRPCTRGRSSAGAFLTARVTVLLAGVCVALRVLPFRVVHRRALSGTAFEAALCPACALSVLARAATLLQHRPTCLARSIVLARMLRQGGRDARVVIGVSRRGGFAAHAWVEENGRAVGEDAGALGRFVALEALGPRGTEGSI